MTEANVRDQRRDTQSIGVGGHRGEHGEAIGRHPRDRIAGRRSREKQMIALDDTGHAERVEPPPVVNASAP